MKTYIAGAMCFIAVHAIGQPSGSTALSTIRLKESAISGDRILLRSPLHRQGIIVEQKIFEPALAGSFATPKIINPGGAASASQYPFMVALGGLTSAVSFKVFCGGTVIHPRYVLTAAHCAAEVQPKLTQVMWGQVDLNKVDKSKISTVVDVFSHERYLNLTGSQYDNDVALLYVDPPMKAPAVLLAGSGPEESGVPLTVMGWGASSVPTFQNGEWVQKFPTKLYFTTLKTGALSDCRARYQGLNPPSQITENMFCASADGTDSCQGDSGGPIGFKGPDGRWRQIGVVSFGVSCATDKFPGVYTRIPQYLSWITQRLGSTVVAENIWGQK